MKKALIAAFLLSMFASASSFGQQILSVTAANQPPFDNLPNLISNHLTGAGIEILEVESSLDPRSIGFFTDGDSAIDLSRGLILTTGFSLSAKDFGSTQASDANLNDYILPELQAIATSTLNDVAFFRITFRPFSDSIRFRYVFGSEEYPEYACSDFNDIFGFFLTGPIPSGGTYDDQNIARIPGTNLVVSINNLHPENPIYSPCPPVNEQFYHDNQNTNEQPVYDGFTDVFVAEARVVPCATYEILIAIADVGDSAYDSGVFLEAKSLESAVEVSSTLEVGEAIIPEIALADTISFFFNDVPAQLLPLQIKIEGTANNGIDFQAIDSVTLVNSPGDVIHILIQPIQDSLAEQLETVVFNVCGMAANACFSKTFTLYIADPDSLYSPIDSLFFITDGSVILSVTPTVVSNKSWTSTNSSSISIEPTGTLIQSEVLVDIPFEILDDLSLLQSVCLNIAHTWDDDLNLYLIAPNKTFVELSTDNGGNGDNYTNTCFSPSATETIRDGYPFAPASAAPFTGIFQPEGPWSDIAGTPINGNWALGVLDDQNNLTGTLLNWSITFSTNELGHFKYKWSTGDTTPSILVTNPGLYSVMVSNNVGAFTKVFVVNEVSVGTQIPDNKNQVFRLLPNPSTGEPVLILDNKLNINALKVYDINGILVLEQASTGRIQGVERLPPGTYIVALECLEGIFTQKMVRW